jgi:hypothetical protein
VAGFGLACRGAPPRKNLENTKMVGPGPIPGHRAILRYQRFQSLTTGRIRRAEDFRGALNDIRGLRAERLGDCFFPDFIPNFRLDAPICGGRCRNDRRSAEDHEPEKLKNPEYFSQNSNCAGSPVRRANRRGPPNRLGQTAVP